MVYFLLNFGIVMGIVKMVLMESGQECIIECLPSIFTKQTLCFNSTNREAFFYMFGLAYLSEEHVQVYEPCRMYCPTIHNFTTSFRYI